ncbi:MAG: hypothetical protein ACLGG3_03935 [Alphaproteobacteria bacterium]
MAEIPVTKKGKSYWWLWLLLAALLILLLIWLFTADEEVEPVEPVEPVAVETVQPVDGTGNETAAAGPVTDMAMLMPAIPADMVGRQFQLNGVQIQEVVGDIGFWIGPSADQRIFAVLTQESTPQTPMEGEADVNAGAAADISGTIRTRGEIIQDFAQGEVANLPQGVDRFLVVESYRVTNQSQ